MQSHSRLAPLSLAVILSLLASSALAGGPPRIAVKALAADSELGSKGFAYQLDAEGCGPLSSGAILAKAEGLVDGERVTRDVLLVPVAGKPGSMLVKKQEFGAGTWLLVFSATGHGKVTALVPQGPSEDAQILPRGVSASEIDSVLRGSRLES